MDEDDPVLASLSEPVQAVERDATGEDREGNEGEFMPKIKRI